MLSLEDSGVKINLGDFSELKIWLEANCLSRLKNSTLKITEDT